MLGLGEGVSRDLIFRGERRGLTPVDCAGVGVAATEGVVGAVTADFSDVDFSAARPAAVYVVLGNEPGRLLAMTHQ